MSELSYLEKLLDGVEVEWKSLGDVVNFQRGRRLVKSQLETRGKYAVYQNSMTPLGYYHEYNVAAQSSFIICAGAAGEIGYSENEFWAADDVHFAITPEYINDRFLFHFLLTQKNKISGQVRRASIPRLSKSVIEKLEFPIPCPDNPEKSLAIQSEIVRILDKFTALTAELTAELTMRKKQYNYYRDQLLSFEGGSVEWKSLGEVAIITIGAFVRKDKQNPDADYPVYNGGRTPTGYYEDFNNDGDKIIVSARGANAGFVNKSSTPYWAGNSCYSISVRSTEQLHWMYVYYYLKQSETKLTGIQQKGGIPAVSKKQMEDLLLPIPSKSEQVRIVTILDKFDTLTSSITEGLPREIELRQKQYEYYRDLLFSFPKPDAVSH
ncbi:restriction endonuclease subunit S [Escherichia coli O169]